MSVSRNSLSKLCFTAKKLKTDVKQGRKYKSNTILWRLRFTIFAV
jgi:hypothetical protein